MASKKALMRTVGEVVEWWLSRIEGDRTRSEKYRGSMGSLMRRHVIPRIGKVLVRKLDRMLLDDKLVFPMHQELAPRTVQKALQDHIAALRRRDGGTIGRSRDQALIRRLRELVGEEAFDVCAQLAAHDEGGSHG